MDRRNTRVLLACEHLETRSVLRRIVQSEDRATIVAEAENSVRAMESPATHCWLRRVTNVKNGRLGRGTNHF